MRLKELREEKGLTQEQVAYAIGISRPAYNQYESGRTRPSYENLFKLADLFATTTDYILEYNNKLVQVR